MTHDLSTIAKIVARAREGGRHVLVETEGMAVLAALGVTTPTGVFLRTLDEITEAALEPIASDRAVIKVVSPDILHKTEAGGVRIADRTVEEIRAAVDEMQSELAGGRIDGYLVQEFVSHEFTFGHELLLGARWTEDFGAIVVFGAGGVRSEFIAQHLKPDRNTAIVRASGEDASDIIGALCKSAAGEAALLPQRGQPPVVDAGRIVEVIERVRAFAREFMPHDVREFEINPLVASQGELVALDALVTLGDGRRRVPPQRPLHKLRNLLQPGSIAIAGVSSRMNPGRVILRNLIRDEFPKENIHIVKPGSEEIDGCRCYDTIADLPGPVDLFVLSIDASSAAGALSEIIERRKAESVILIPGGFEEKTGGMEIVERMKAALSASRSSEWQGPLINGGNSLGIRSRPGGYDTLFIPEHKLGLEHAREAPVAFISQSGAFAISKNSKLRTMRPRYTITVGNQMDVTVGDYLTYLKDDSEVDIFAVYVEGFRELDGERFLNAARDIVAGGRTVILYRAGRSKAGTRAAASHTAAIAGDYRATRALAESVGVVVADSLSDFEDLIMLFHALDGRQVHGRRLGAVSNAGYECVAIADNVGTLELAELSEQTTTHIREALASARLTGVVDVNNPVDLTPIMSEAGYEAVVAAVLADAGVDVGVVGCVPMTPALATLPAAAHHDEDVASPQSIAHRVAGLFHAQPKPFVAVVDAGPAYDAMVHILTEKGIPTFRTADRALRLLARYCESRLLGHRR